MLLADAEKELHPRSFANRRLGYQFFSRLAVPRHREESVPERESTGILEIQNVKSDEK
jgi:hypothetical protein